MTLYAGLTTDEFGRWEVYVATDAACQDWPAHSFGRTSPIPALEERAAALASLGYGNLDGGQWEWMEVGAGDTDDAVRLLASVDVRPIGGNR
ncbi:DUF6303 family protein [Streptomyces sp. NPDC002467]|uniref:DUF6303 family protein n=1 Tax=Streptomyces sp. NPDC002467 TaxID=3364647 RepID=UPI0036B2288A